MEADRSKQTHGSKWSDPISHKDKAPGNAVTQPQFGLAGGEVVTKGFLEEGDARAGKVTRWQSGERGGVTVSPLALASQKSWVMLEPGGWRQEGRGC